MMRRDTQYNTLDLFIASIHFDNFLHSFHPAAHMKFIYCLMDEVDFPKRYKTPYKLNKKLEKVDRKFRHVC